MQDFSITVLSSVTASGALTGFLLWLSKTWISENLKSRIKLEYEQRLETYKVQLRAQHETEIERLRADLRIAAFERETRFAKLHVQRAETIAKVYALLQEFYGRVFDYVRYFGTASDEPLVDRRESVNKTMKEFGDFYRPNRIFLPAETEQRVTELQNELFSLARRFKTGVEDGHDERTGRDSWGESFDNLQIKAKPLFEELMAEFRRLLGDNA